MFYNYLLFKNKTKRITDSQRNRIAKGEIMVFFCHTFSVPHGPAETNRMLGLAKCLKEYGEDVCIIGTINCKEDEEFTYEGIRYKNIPLNSNNPIKKKMSLYYGAKTIISYINNYVKKSGIEKMHIVLCSEDALFCYPFLSLKRRGIDVLIDVVEWYDFRELKGVFKYSHYFCFYKIAPRFRIIAISSLINEHFKSIGCETSIIPPIIDTRKFSAAEQCNNSNEDECFRFIFNGRLGKKDIVSNVFKALLLMEPQKRKKIKITITGESAEEVIEKCGLREDEYNQIQSCLNLTGWISYEEMTALIQESDFGIIIRRYCQATQANFPSKIPELMANGLPIVINPTGDIGQYLNSGNAVILNSNDEMEIKNKFESLTNYTKEEIIGIKQKAKKDAYNFFDYRNWSEIVGDYVFKEIND